jgi:hypothetical protein
MATVVAIVVIAVGSLIFLGQEIREIGEATLTEEQKAAIDAVGRTTDCADLRSTVVLAQNLSRQPDEYWFFYTEMKNAAERQLDRLRCGR